MLERNSSLGCVILWSPLNALRYTITVLIGIAQLTDSFVDGLLESPRFYGLFVQIKIFHGGFVEKQYGLISAFLVIYIF